MIKYTLQGIPVNDETLAVDVIHDVGPKNDFLGHDHTFKHMQEQSQPTLIDRRMREDWQADGSTDLHQRATEKARQILETHQPEPLPEEVLAKMRSIVEEAEEELGVKK
jgi:trimethylamine--corrinoid protein Co-methyltransferase